MTLLTARNAALLALVAGLMLFDYGFMLLRIPPVQGGGVPLSELVLLGSLATLRYPTVLPRLARALPLLPLAVWWLHGLLAALAGASQHGLWALRDASHLLESFFLLPGFVLAARPAWRDRALSWLVGLSMLLSLKALTFPFVHTLGLAALSPTVTTAAGLPVSLFWNYSMAPVGALLVITWWLLPGSPGTTRSRRVAAVALLVFVLLVFQARTVYLQTLFLLGMLLLQGGRGLRAAVWLVVAAALLIAAATVADLPLRGRLGAPIGGEFLMEHLGTITGVQGSEQTRGAASGVGQRLAWWASIANRLSEQPHGWLTGLGYGIPLTDFFISEQVQVREPHNSFVSIVARLGLLGLAAWLALHVSLFRAWLRARRRAKSEGQARLQAQLTLLLVLVGLVWILALGEDAFEKPYCAVPYYFFWGVLVRYGLGPTDEEPGSRQIRGPGG